MPFQQDIAYADDVGNPFGKYHSTFRSTTGQVSAQLFERNGWLIAYISFPEDLKPGDETDPYIGELNRHAKEHGFDGKLKTIYIA